MNPLDCPGAGRGGGMLNGARRRAVFLAPPATASAASEKEG